jgi:hypothetical protein
MTAMLIMSAIAQAQNNKYGKHKSYTYIFTIFKTL